MEKTSETGVRLLPFLFWFLIFPSGALADPPRVGEPYELLGKRLVFTNWTYVRPGQVGWYDPDGNAVNADPKAKIGPFDAI